MAFYIIEPNIAKINKLPKEYFLYILLLVFAFLGYPNIISEERFFRYVQVIFANFFLMVLVYYAISNIKEWQLIWKSIWIAGLAICIASFFTETVSISSDDYERLEGIVGNANGTANYARVAIIASLINLQFYNRIIWKIILWASIFFFSYVIVLTASRGVFGNLVFIIGGYFALKYFRGWRVIILLLILLVIGNFIIFSANSFFDGVYLYQRLTRNESLSGAIEDESRMQLYSTAWKYFLDFPLLGVGLNQFRFFSEGKISHTDILDVLVQLGIFAGMVYVSIYVRLFNKIMKLTKSIEGEKDRHIYHLILLCFISELFFGLSNPNWFTQLEMIVLSLLIIYTVKIKKTNAIQTTTSI